ncbi:unnamed protein product [Amoebophrya sp. A25]|nr:unnamed protein product [Amoebophrya sp. A25]|eukprot:GSA25T00009504001.1
MTNYEENMIGALRNLQYEAKRLYRSSKISSRNLLYI